MEKPKFITKECKHHGMTEHVLEGRGYYRCKTCRSERVIKSRRNAINRVKIERGGKCKRCGYDTSLAALDFHHRDSAEKEFKIGQGDIVSLTRLRQEAEKCDLLCSNCHREYHAGVWSY